MTTPFGLYEFKRMSFSLTNTPATFWRLMDCCLGPLNFRTCFIYLDEVIVFATSFPEMLERLEEVLQRLGEYGLKLKISWPCGVEPDPEKSKVLKDWRLRGTIQLTAEDSSPLNGLSLEFLGTICMAPDSKR